MNVHSQRLAARAVAPRAGLLVTVLLWCDPEVLSGFMPSFSLYMARTFETGGPYD